MFTGIVEEIGTVRSIVPGRDSAVLDIAAEKVLDGTILGDSIATSGVCLTVTSVGDGHFTADVMHETLKRSALGSLTAGSKVNLERAMRPDGRLGGHIVTGHVDACGRVVSLVNDGIAVVMTVSMSEELLRFVARKGSVTLNGVSLTVVDVWRDSFAVSLIPHTRNVTTLGLLRTGSPVNVEVDTVARYIERLLSFGQPEHAADNSGKGLTLEFLAENGF